MKNSQSQQSKKAAPEKEAKLTWIPHKTFELEIIIPWPEVAKAYGKVLEETAKNTIVKGFRKGKAPKKMVEEQVGKEPLYEKVIQKLITSQYIAALQHHQLRPIINPKIEAIKLKEGKDWVVKATACETPDITLGKWEEVVKGANAVTKIWTPKSSAPAQEPKKNETPSSQPDTQEKLGKIFTALLGEAKVDLAPILVQEETNRTLANIIDQVNKLGMTVDQYLASKNLTPEAFRQQQQKQAEQTLKLEFILAKIGELKHLSASEAEVNQTIKEVADEKERQRLSQPGEKAYIASILRKRKTIDYLLHL